MSKLKLDITMKKLRIQPVGWGYIDCICPIESINTFINLLNELKIDIEGFDWWEYVPDVHNGRNIYGMGGPRNDYGPGWYSEICSDEYLVFDSNDDVKAFLLNEWPHSDKYISSFVPGIDLKVPNNWRNPWRNITKEKAKK